MDAGQMIACGSASKAMRPQAEGLMTLTLLHSYGIASVATGC